MQSHSLIVRTKLTPIRPHKRTLYRPRVAARLHEALTYPLTMLRAGPGFGKSTALAALTTEEAALDAVQVWYHLNEEDRDAAVFLLYMLHGFAGVLGDALAAPLAVLDQTDEATLNWERAVDTLINALLDCGPVLFIIDDAHLLNDSPQALAILDRLLRFIPPNLHLILSTRYPLKLDYLKLGRVRGDVLDIGEDDLAFSPAEIDQLFREQYGLNLQIEEVAILAEETQGWAIALQLIWQGLPEGALSTLAQVLKRFFQQKDNLFTYLAEEVFEQQPPDLQQFLETTAVLRDMTPRICDCLRGAGDSDIYLRQLLEADLFVQELDDGTIRYHRLFREFLLGRANHGGEHSRAAHCLEDAGYPEEALYHTINAGDSHRAASLIAQMGRQMVRAGLLGRLSEWIHSLPPEALAQEPVLLVFLGDIARLQSRFDEALSAYAQAQERFQGDVQGTCEALRGQARVYLDTVNPSKAEHLLREALRLSDGQQSRETHASLLELLAENQLNRGFPEEAERLRHQALALRQEGPGEEELDVRVMLRTGRLAEARHHLEARVRLERDDPVLRPRAHRETLLLLSFVEACFGEVKAAARHAEEGTERGRALNSPFVTAVGLMRQGHAALLRDGRAEEARRCFEEAIAIGENLSVDRLKVEALWGLCRVHGYRGDLTLAEEAALQALELAAQAGDEWIGALTELAMGGSAVLAGAYETAAAYLAHAVESFRRCLDTFGLTTALLWQALFYQRTGDAIRVDLALAEVFALIAEHEYEHVFSRRFLTGPPEPRVLVPLLLRARSSDDEAVSAAASSLLKRMGLQGLEFHPGYQLRVETLGPFRLLRGSQPADSSDWQREKAKHLFLLMVTHRRSLLDRERIMAYLWPEARPSSAAQSFKVTLNALYHALEPDRVPGSPSAYITREGSHYGLRPSADLWLDVVAFEEAVEQGDAHFPGDVNASLRHYHAALALYNGDYLHEFGEEWLREERERLQALYLRTADRVAQVLVEREQWTEAIDVCHAMISRDDCWERAYRLLMRAHSAMGNRPRAIRIYQRLVERLRDELDTVPSEQTTLLYESITG